jgi:hypothetical protein
MATYTFTSFYTCGGLIKLGELTWNENYGFEEKIRLR